jgi:phage shock protein A
VFESNHIWTGAKTMGAFSRIRYVIAANVNALIEKAEDPEKLLKALIREMEDAGEDARLATADLLAEQTHLERLQEQFEGEITEWQERAEKAVAQDRDDLARTAIKAKADLEQRCLAAAGERRVLDERISLLEKDMTTLKQKLSEAKAKLREMASRPAAKPAATPYDEASLSPAERKIRHAMGRFDRLQSQVERLEARVRSYEVGGPVPPAWKDDTQNTDPVIEAELSKLKQSLKTGSTRTDNSAKAEPDAVEKPEKASVSED